MVLSKAFYKIKSLLEHLEELMILDKDTDLKNTPFPPLIKNNNL